MDLVFVFIEADRARFVNLQRKLSEFRLPSNIHVHPEHATFEEYVGTRLEALEQQNLTMAPSLTFVDPFGPTGFRMSLIERLARHPRSEVLINFSYQPMNQWFLQDPTKHGRLDELFGDARWRPSLGIMNPQQKEDFLVREYQTALKERGWQGFNFRMVNKHNQTQYHLLFGTKHPLGKLIMKRAMWSVSPDGDFQYSDLSNPAQQRLFSGALDEDYAKELAGVLWRNRRGRHVKKQELIDKETADHPTCLERHLTRALIILEYESEPPRIGDVTKANGTPRRARTYPDGCTIQFAA